MHFADRAFIAETTAKMLLEVKAVLFFEDQPFVFTSGWASPVYIDCRKLIFYPRLRSQLVDFAVATLARDVGFEQFDVVAGGETAGIPYAAWIAERLALPMQYARRTRSSSTCSSTSTTTSSPSRRRRSPSSTCACIISPPGGTCWRW